ncbi:hypothetical protein C7293_23865 [filamentous cyanobacterium CCT1]|nr:hypothetical protein C7293_23865 [filamentous cyanobacterium CCT1]PSN80767.1 hypothetical protein C8B47_04880 [filamentous cyanobacterium CCP4]
MITLVNPPNPPKAVSNKDMMGGLGQLYSSEALQKIPAIDIPYSAALIRKKGMPVQVIDCLGSDWDISELLIFLQENNSELIAIRTSTPTFEWDMRVAKLIKTVTKSLIIIFGPHVQIFPNETLKHSFVDAIVLGEPELTLLEIADKGLNSGIEGLWYKDEGRVFQNSPRKLIENLDNLPFPAWDLMPYSGYEGTNLMKDIKPFVTIQSSRGCPHSCTYCPYPVTQGRNLRARSPQNVVDELDWLSKKLEVKSVLFRDPEFALYRDRVVKICEGIIARNIKMAWRCETRLKDLDESLIALMAQAGCIGINMGIESGDDEVLKNVKRRIIPLDQAQSIIKSCHKHNIESFCFFILGLPGETSKSARKTINYALNLKADFVQFTVSTPYPGTELREWAEDKGFISSNSLDRITGYNAAMRNEALSAEEIQKLQWLAQESIEMQRVKMAKRCLADVRLLASELKRWFKFQKTRRQFYWGI